MFFKIQSAPVLGRNNLRRPEPCEITGRAYWRRIQRPRTGALGLCVFDNFEITAEGGACGLRAVRLISAHGFP